MFKLENLNQNKCKAQSNCTCCFCLHPLTLTPITLYSYDENRGLYSILLLKNKVESRIIVNKNTLLVPVDKGLTITTRNENISKDDLRSLIVPNNVLQIKPAKPDKNA